MPRLLGIDFGTKHVGLAISDESQKFAFPHATLDTTGDIVKKIGELCAREGISQIVVGLPQAPGSMSDTAITQEVRKFAESLKILGLLVDFEPEFFSTSEAKKSNSSELAEVRPPEKDRLVCIYGGRTSVYTGDMRFAPGEFYHIVNRGIEGKTIFPQKSDYQRFLLGLREFNSLRSKELRLINTKNTEVEPPENERLVDILSYCLMKNHVHLFIRALDAHLASKFLQKKFGGYTMYFNTKYQRKGVLFQSKAKVIHIKRGVHFDHLFKYIHLNPLDYVDRNWREHALRDKKSARDAILSYPWSSIRALIGEGRDDIINLSLAQEFMKSKDEFIDDVLSWSTSDRELYGGSTSEWE